MASTPVSKVSKTKPKKTLKRMMLAAPEEINILTIDESTDSLIASELSDYLKEFTDREAIRCRVMLGLNTITRSVEMCTDNLKAVLLNANTRPQRLITHLQQLCRHKGVPVAAIKDMPKIAKSLQGSVKGLKTNVTAVGILGGCSAAIVQLLTSKLPPVQLRSAAELPQKEATPSFRPPPRPEVDVRAFYIETKDSEEAAEMADDSRLDERRTAGDFGADIVDLTETTFPFVDYGSFIGSNRPIEAPAPIKQPAKFQDPQPSTSGYKPPIVKIR